MTDTAGVAAHIKKPVSWVRNNVDKLPHYVCGRQYRFKLSEVDAALMKSSA